MEKRTVFWFFVMAILAIGPSMYATEFIVNSIADDVDINPGNGVCETSTGVCTLRAAIQETNALSGDDTIILPNNTYILDIQGNLENEAATGDLDITDNLTLQGSGNSLSIIDANTIDRAIQTFMGLIVQISNISIQNGSANMGGGIFNHADLTLTNVAVCNNQATGFGGGIFNGGDLVLTDSTVCQNNASSGGGINNLAGKLELNNTTVSENRVARGFGGGILNVEGNVTVTNSTLEDNFALHRGGGLYFGAGQLNIHNTKILSNNTQQQDGGGIYVSSGNINIFESEFAFNKSEKDEGGGISFGDIEVEFEGNALIKDSLFHNNESQSGGALSINGSLIIEESIFRNNIAVQDGGGIVTRSSSTNRARFDRIVVSNNSAQSGGGVSSCGATISNSTINGNQTIQRNDVPLPLNGGGIYQRCGDLFINNTTISHNQAMENGGGVWLEDGADFRNVTISNNSAESAGGGIFSESGTVARNVTIAENFADKGGGINSIAGSVGLTNSIVANNHAQENCVGNFTGSQNNISNDSSCFDSDPADPLLGPLTNNGGVTETHALLTGSPAKDRSFFCLPTDQRGAMRPSGDFCDLGAFESQLSGVQPPPPNGELFDFGDAPERPYSSSFAQSGILHKNNKKISLGEDIDYEFNAEVADRDEFDDATFRFFADSSGNLFFETNVSASSDAPSAAYLNVLVDFEGTCTEHDFFGGWSDPGNHVVQNEQVSMIRGATTMVQAPVVSTELNFNNHWLRITLTDEPIMLASNDTWDGRSNKVFQMGETEDHCVNDLDEVEMDEDATPTELSGRGMLAFAAPVCDSSEFSHALTVKWDANTTNEVNVSITLTLPNGETQELNESSSQGSRILLLVTSDGGQAFVTATFEIESNDPIIFFATIFLTPCVEPPCEQCRSEFRALLELDQVANTQFVNGNVALNSKDYDTALTQYRNSLQTRTSILERLRELLEECHLSGEVLELIQQAIENLEQYLEAFEDSIDLIVQASGESDPDRADDLEDEAVEVRRDHSTQLVSYVNALSNLSNLRCESTE